MLCFVIWPGTGGVFPHRTISRPKISKGPPEPAGDGVGEGYEGAAGEDWVPRKREGRCHTFQTFAEAKGRAF